MSEPSQKAAYTRSPSVAGVEEASVFLGCVLALCPRTERDQRSLPVEADTHTSCRSLPPAGDVCTNTRSPQTTGDELPRPGSGVFQRTPLVSDHWTGTPLSAATPVPLGPRKRGQLSALPVAATR